jgi:hypothetical protein
MSPFLSLVAARVHSISPDITYYCSLDVLRLRGYGTPRSPGGPGGNTGQHGMSGGEWGLVLAHAAVALISYAIPWVDHRPAYYLKLQELSATGASLRSPGHLVGSLT